MKISRNKLEIKPPKLDLPLKENLVSKSESKSEIKTTEADDLGLQEENLPCTEYCNDIVQNFRYPHYGKYVAWLLSFSVIFAGNGLVIYKGLAVGERQGILWLGVYLLSLVLLFFVFYPIVYGLYAAVIDFIYDFHREVHYKKIRATLFSNEYDADKAEIVKEFRLENVTSYIATPDPINQQKRLDFFYKRERFYLLTDISATLLLLFLLFLVGFSDYSSYSVFLKRTITKLAVDGVYTKSIPLRGVSSMDQFQEYLKDTLLPALLTNNSNYSYPEFPKTMIDGYPLTELHLRGWTRDQQVKLIGQPRILQKRVKAGKCYRKSVKGIKSCQGELNAFNHDTADYGLGWEPLLVGEGQLNLAELKPWIYQNWNEVQDSLRFGRLASCLTYGQGGYVIFLGKNMANAAIILDFIEYFNWIDFRTRAIFIDFVTYAPGANLFNMATIVFEVSATGVFISSYRMHSLRLLNKEPLFYSIVFGKLAVLIACVGYLAVTEISKCVKVGLDAYFRSGWEILNTVQVVVGLFSVLATSLAIGYASMLDDQLDSVADDNFVNFERTCFLDHARNNLNAFLLAIEAVKIIRYLGYLLPCRRFQQKISKSLRFLLASLVIISFACFSFSILFHQIMGTKSERFSSITTSWVQTFSNTIGVDELLFHSEYFGIVFPPLFLITLYCVSGLPKAILAVNIAGLCKETIQLKTETPKNQRNFGLLRLNDDILINGMSINVFRLLQMKRLALETITGKSYADDTALAVVALTLSGRDRHAGSKDFYMVRDNGAVTIDEAREQQMKKRVIELLTKLTKKRR